MELSESHFWGPPLEFSAEEVTQIIKIFRSNQSTLVYSLGISKHTLQKWFKNEDLPTADELLNILEVLNETVC